MTTHWSCRRCMMLSHTVVLPEAVPPAIHSFHLSFMSSHSRTWSPDGVDSSFWPAGLVAALLPADMTSSSQVDVQSFGHVPHVMVPERCGVPLGGPDFSADGCHLSALQEIMEPSSTRMRTQIIFGWPAPCNVMAALTCVVQNCFAQAHSSLACACYSVRMQDLTDVWL